MVREELSEDQATFITSQTMFFYQLSMKTPNCFYMAETGFVRILNNKQLMSQAMTATECSTQWVILANPEIGMLFVDFETPNDCAFSKSEPSTSPLLILKGPTCVKVNVSQVGQLLSIRPNDSTRTIALYTRFQGQRAHCDLKRIEVWINS